MRHVVVTAGGSNATASSGIKMPAQLPDGGMIPPDGNKGLQGLLADPEFQESNLKHAINGEQTRAYLQSDSLGKGPSPELLPCCSHGCQQ